MEIKYGRGVLGSRMWKLLMVNVWRRPTSLWGSSTNSNIGIRMWQNIRVLEENWDGLGLS